MTVRDEVQALQRQIIGDLQQQSNDSLLARANTDRMVIVAGRAIRELVWLDTERGDRRIIVQHHDEHGAYMWADGFVIASDETRRPLTDVERREYL